MKAVYAFFSRFGINLESTDDKQLLFFEDKYFYDYLDIKRLHEETGSNYDTTEKLLKHGFAHVMDIDELIDLHNWTKV